MGALMGPSSGASFGQQSWAGAWTHHQAEVPHVTTEGIGAGASVCEESACVFLDSMYNHVFQWESAQYIVH